VSPALMPSARPAGKRLGTLSLKVRRPLGTTRLAVNAQFCARAGI